MATFIVTWNPRKWSWDPVKRSRDVRATASGRRARTRWSTGNRKSGITPREDRVFLLRQGVEPRGVIGSGWFASKPEQGPHWDGTPGKLANYADISWDVVLGDGDLLPLDLVKSQVATLDWDHIQAGGVLLPDPGDQHLERVWATHTGEATSIRAGASRGARSRGWQSDPAKRRLVEDHAQALLEQHFRRKRWKVRDTRRGNPYDAVATKGKQTRYLEAKGTETDGATVLVTEGEVKFARAHRGECVIGILSGIRFRPDGTLDGASGRLTVHDWDPDNGVLSALTYTWKPSAN